MSFLTEKFVLLAVREDESPERAGGVPELAACRCIGAIAQAATNSEEFVNAGLIFLEGFEEMAQAAIDDRDEFREALGVAWGDDNPENPAYPAAED